MSFGQILVTQHPGFKHVAFEGFFGQTIEYNKRSGPPQVRVGTVEEVFRSGPTRRYNYPPDAPYTAEQAYERLLSRLGERRYDVMTNNCESLIHWAMYGDGFTPQGKALAGLALAALFIGGAVLVAKAA